MKTLKGILVAAVVAVMVACGTTRTVPLTGRTQKVADNAQMLSLSLQEYQSYMKTAKKSTNAANTAMVERVGMAAAVETYLRNNGYESELQGYQWEFNLVQNNEVNAWCMPGGKIVVYEGLLPVTQTEDALAIVLGHEIAHAVAMHSAEQYQKKLNQQSGLKAGAVLATVLGAGSTATSVGVQAASQYLSFRNLSYSRDNESEADHLGLIFAAMAGYDPQVAVDWISGAVWAAATCPNGRVRTPATSDASPTSRRKCPRPCSITMPPRVVRRRRRLRPRPRRRQRREKAITSASKLMVHERTVGDIPCPPAVACR